MAERCGAKCSTGKPCTAWRMTNGRCRMHGGKTPSGIAAGSFKTGRYSKDMPLHLVTRYQQALNDPQLLSLRDDVAVCESRISELLQRVQAGNTRERWDGIRDAYTGFVTAQQARDVRSMQVHLDTMNTLLQQQPEDYQAWDALQRLWETRRRLTETEQKTLIMQQQMLSIGQMLVAVGLIEQMIHRRVTEYASPDIATAILTAVSQDLKQETALGIIN